MDQAVPLAFARKSVFDLRPRKRAGERAIAVVLFLCAALSILMTAGIVVILAEQSLRFFLTPGVTLRELSASFEFSSAFSLIDHLSQAKSSISIARVPPSSSILKTGFSFFPRLR